MTCSLRVHITELLGKTMQTNIKQIKDRQSTDAKITTFTQSKLILLLQLVLILILTPPLPLPSLIIVTK